MDSLLKQLDELIAEKKHPEFIVVDNQTYDELLINYLKAYPARPTRSVKRYHGIRVAVTRTNNRIIIVV